MKKVFFTVDVEVDFPPHGKGFYGIEEGLSFILSTLKQFDAPATFFVTADVAQKFPELVKHISENHEIASHGLTHANISRLSKTNLYRNLKKSKIILQNVVKKRVKGYRSPYLKYNKYLFPLLKKAGYEYDSSLMLKSRRKPTIKELPVAFRSAMLEHPLLVRQMFRKSDPLCIYVHNWQYYPFKKRLKLPTRPLSIYLNTKKTRLNLIKNLTYLTKNHRFCRCEEY